MEIALLHPAFQQHDVICRLLCTSKALRADIAATCRGQVRIEHKTYDVDSIRQLAAWISNHSQLLSALSWDMPLDCDFMAAQTALGAALQHAATAHPADFQLQEYHSRCPSDTILQQLPCSHLTSLSFSYHPEHDDLSQLSTALAQLTALRRLSMHSRDIGVLLAIRDLEQLTHLDLGTVRNLRQLQLLPTKIQRLYLILCSSVASQQDQEHKQLQQQQLNLGHLTAAVELQLRAPSNTFCTAALPEEALVTVHPGDVLPPNLTKLVLGDCPSCQPLLHLKQLQVLQLYAGCTMPADHMLKLATSLHHLTDCQFRYVRPQDTEAPAAAWVAMPISSISISNGLTEDSACQLLALTGLTSLQLEDCRPLGMTDQRLGAVLQQLTQLRVLCLSNVLLLPDSCSCSTNSSMNTPPRSSGSQSMCSSVATAAHGAACHQACDSSSGSGIASMRHVLAAIGKMPQLSFLSVESPADAGPVSGHSCGCGCGAAEAPAAAAAVVRQLTSLSQLTHLSLIGCGLDDAAVIPLCRKLTRLKELVLDGNWALTDRTVFVIASNLRRLVGLSMNDTSVTDHGVSRLRLQSLCVNGTSVSIEATEAACTGCGL